MVVLIAIKLMLPPAVTAVTVLIHSRVMANSFHCLASFVSLSEDGARDIKKQVNITPAPLPLLVAAARNLWLASRSNTALPAPM